MILGSSMRRTEGPFLMSAEVGFCLRLPPQIAVLLRMLPLPRFKILKPRRKGDSSLTYMKVDTPQNRNITLNEASMLLGLRMAKQRPTISGTNYQCTCSPCPHWWNASTCTGSRLLLGSLVDGNPWGITSTKNTLSSSNFAASSSSTSRSSSLPVALVGRGISEGHTVSSSSH
jgi:hypothetical protein